MATKADCGVSSRRQRLGLKLPWNTKPTLDTCRPSSTSVLRISRALVHQLNSQSEWSDSPTDQRAPTAIQHVELVGRQTKTARRPTVGLVCGEKETLSSCTNHWIVHSTNSFGNATTLCCSGTLLFTDGAKVDKITVSETQVTCCLLNCVSNITLTMVWYKDRPVLIRFVHWGTYSSLPVS